MSWIQLNISDKFHERKRFTCHKNYVNKQKGLQKKKFQKSTETEAIRCRIQWLFQCSCVHFFKSVDSWAIFNLYNTLHLHCFNNNLSFFINQAMTQKEYDSSVTFKNRYTHGTSFQITEWLNTKTFILCNITNLKYLYLYTHVPLIYLKHKNFELNILIEFNFTFLTEI